MPLYRLGEHSPDIDPSAYVAPKATVIGRVKLGAHASVWFGAVIRGDNEPITLGACSNVQEDAVLHTDPGFPLMIGPHVTVGHQAMLHGCTIGERCLIGIQAVVMNEAVIARNSLVGAGAIVTEGKQFPERSPILGTRQGGAHADRRVFGAYCRPARPTMRGGASVTRANPCGSTESGPWSCVARSTRPRRGRRSFFRRSPRPQRVRRPVCPADPVKRARSLRRSSDQGAGKWQISLKIPWA